MPYPYTFLPTLRPLALAIVACCAAPASAADEAPPHAGTAARADAAADAVRADTAANPAAGGDGILPTVRVKASRGKPEGTADRGYRSSTAGQVGALGAKALQDTPFSLYVIPRDLMDNVQASKPDDIIKINPVLQLNNPQSRFFSGVTMRGFSVGSNKRIDGQPNANMISVDMEDKERVEVLTGLSGFLYGPGNVGGTLNYVLKRPSAERFTRITTGITEGSNAYVHGDFNLPLDGQGRLSSRLNVVAQDGDTATDHQSINRQLVSGALDWSVSPGLKMQLDASYSHYRMRGTNPYWAVDAGVPYPDAPDLDRYWGQPFTRTDTHQAHAAARLQWDVSDAVGIRAGVARRTSDSALVAVNNTFTAQGGAYRVQSSEWEYPDITNEALYALADVRFRTGPAAHKVTAGFFGDIDERTNYRSSPGGWASNTAAGFNLSSPVYFGTPPLPATGAKYVANRTRTSNLVLGDDIELGPHWGALVGVTHSSIDDRAFSDTGATTSAYDRSRLSPSASLLYKPTSAVTVYGSYIEGMEKGGTAAATYNGQAVTNAGEIKPPLVSRQFELGVKATVGGSLLTAALFQIDKGLQYYERSGSTGPYTFVQDGRQVHQGLELTSTGRVLPHLTVVAGATLMDAKVTRNRQTPALEGKTPANVAEHFAKVYAEYDVAAVAGLTLTGGLYHTGRQAVDALNTGWIPDFTTVDIGTRYRTRVGGLPVTLRLNVNNLTGKDYWLTANSLGAPRTVAVSAQLDL